jgi:hypothetical protein
MSALYYSIESRACSTSDQNPIINTGLNQPARISHANNGGIGFPQEISLTDTLLPKELEFYALQNCEEEEDIGGKVRENAIHLVHRFTIH